MAPRQSMSTVARGLMTLKRNQNFKRTSKKITKSVLKPLHQENPQQSLFKENLAGYMKLRFIHQLDGRKPSEIHKFKPAVTLAQLEADLKQFIKQNFEENRPSRRCSFRRRVNLETIDGIMARIQRLSLENTMDRFGSIECIMKEMQKLTLEYDESMIIDQFGSVECLLTEIQKLTLDACDEGTLMKKFGSLESIMEEIKICTG